MGKLKKIVLYLYIDSDFESLLKYISSFVNDVIYPSWFRNRSIFFLSKFDKRFYNVSKISFKSQVKLGKFYVDFILEVNNSKVIVECDGKDYHDPEKDKERDKVLTIEGDLGGDLGR